MALQSSGAISLSEIRTEFVGGSSAISLATCTGAAQTSGPTHRTTTRPTLLHRFRPAGQSPSTSSTVRPRASATPKRDRTNWSPHHIFGSDLNVDYPKTYIVASGRTITNHNLNGIAFNVPSGAQNLTLTINGIIRTYSGYALRNQSSSTVTVNGSGSIRKNNKDGFNSTFSGNGSSEMTGVGGFGGASGPDLWHSDYGTGGIDCKVTRSGNTFTASWTYNECDYLNLGGLL